MCNVIKVGSGSYQSNYRNIYSCNHSNQREVNNVQAVPRKKRFGNMINKQGRKQHQGHLGNVNDDETIYTDCTRM